MTPFDATQVDWVTVTASSCFFEPWCTLYSPTEPGEVVITFGNSRTRHRGVEVAAHEPDGVSVWVPAGGRVFWRPAADINSASAPWETRLREWDYQRGAFL